MLLSGYRGVNRDQPMPARLTRPQWEQLDKQIAEQLLEVG